jgi:quaternary ammonium compound-resistance protein SugE
MNYAWLWVILGGIVEAVYTTFMGLADGLSDITYTILGLAFSIVGTLLLNEGLKRGLQMGASYAVWVGVGVAGAAIADVMVFNNGPGILSYMFLALILGGVVGLNLKADKTASNEANDKS